MIATLRCGVDTVPHQNSHVQRRLVGTLAFALAVTATCHAQAPATAPSRDDIQTLQGRLTTLQQSEDSNPYLGSPALTLANPTGFGAANNTGFFGLSYQARIRPSQTDSDAGAVIGIGLFDPRDVAGLELSYTAASLNGRTRPFGSGGFNAKIHHRFTDDLSVAVGYNGFANIGQSNTVPGFTNDFTGSLYAAATQIFRTQDDINAPFSRIALTVGAGNGQYRTVPTILLNNGGVGVFSSLAFRIAQPVSAIVEWTGQDLAAAVSFVPFAGIPFYITPGVRDLAGEGLNGSRFVLGTGFSFKF